MSLLTAVEVKNAGVGKHHDGRGLFLRVYKSGSRCWVLRLTVDGRRREIGLGGWPEVSLADARAEAFEHRAAAASGRDPLADKRRGGVPTFREAAERVLDANRARWRSDRTAKLWWASLENHAFGVIGDMSVDRISQSDVLRCVEPMWATRTETARKLRQRIRTVLRWCQAHGYVQFNMAGEVIDGALPPMPRVKSHFRSLPYTEVAEALAVVEESGASPSANRPEGGNLVMWTTWPSGAPGTGAAGFPERSFALGGTAIAETDARSSAAAPIRLVLPALLP